MEAGSSVVNVSSSSGSGWRKNLPLLRSLLETPSFDTGADRYIDNEALAGHGYVLSKEALNAWTLQQSVTLIKRGIRVNAVSPGVVQTPLIEIAEKAFPVEFLSSTVGPVGRRSSVSEQVGPILFLNSDNASFVNGADLAVDGGYWASQSLEGSLW